MMSNVVNPGV